VELLQLRYFRKVAKLEHMSQAAQELHIAQPALSKTIARLEENIGVPLFDRHGGRIRLNSFGKVYLEKVEKALNLLDEANLEVTELAGMENGSIHLATSTLDRLSEPLSEFVMRYPKVRLQISQGSMEEIGHLIASGEADIGFTAMPFDRPGFIQKTVLSEELYLAVPKNHRLANRTYIHLDEAANESFIGYKEENPFQKMNDIFFQKARISPQYVCRVDEPSAILSLVRAGLGVALFGCKSREDSKLVLLPIESPVCRRNFHIVWNEQRYFSVAARKFCDFVIQYFASQN